MGTSGTSGAMGYRTGFCVHYRVLRTSFGKVIMPLLQNTSNNGGFLTKNCNSCVVGLCTSVGEMDVFVTLTPEKACYNFVAQLIRNAFLGAYVFYN